MGPAGGSGHPWGVPDGSHTVIYGLLFDVATDLYVKMAQNDPKWPKMAQNRPQQTAILRSASVLKFAPLKVVWGLFDTEKKLYKCPFGPEPIAGAKIPGLFACLYMSVSHSRAGIFTRKSFLELLIRLHARDHCR